MNENPVDNLGFVKKEYTKVHAVFAVVSLIIAGFYYRHLLNGAFWNGNGIPVVVFAIVFCLVGFLFFKFRGKKMSGESVFFMVLTCLYSLRYVVIANSSAEICLLCILVIHLCALLFAASVNGNVIDNIVPSVFRAALAAPFSSFFALPVSFSAFFAGSGKNEGTKKSEKAALVAAGIFVSVPVVAVVLVLLSSDVFFLNLMGRLFDFLFNISIRMNFFDYFNIISILIAFYIFGAFYTADTKPVCRRGNSGIVPRTVADTVKVMLTAVYLLFALAQIEGYTCILTGRIPSGTSYAEFARSGFFELCIAACINGVVLYVSDAVCEKENNRLTKPVSMILVCITLFIILTSAVKMIMYITAYGFTPKRFYTMWFMILIAVIFSMATVKLRKEKFRLSAYSVYTAAAMLFVLFFADYEWISKMLNEMCGF